jgi:CBS domain-containing protein
MSGPWPSWPSGRPFGLAGGRALGPTGGSAGGAGGGAAASWQRQAAPLTAHGHERATLEPPNPAPQRAAQRQPAAHKPPLPSSSKPLLQVTGLPVVGATGTVVGVISRKDIIQVRQSGGSMQERVRAHMTAPAITVTPGTPVAEAGALMLREKIRRLPVVDAEDKPLGCAAGLEGVCLCTVC